MRRSASCFCSFACLFVLRSTRKDPGQCVHGPLSENLFWQMNVVISHRTPFPFCIYLIWAFAAPSLCGCLLLSLSHTLSLSLSVSLSVTLSHTRTNPYRSLLLSPEHALYALSTSRGSRYSVAAEMLERCRWKISAGATANAERRRLQEADPHIQTVDCVVSRFHEFSDI